MEAEASPLHVEFPDFSCSILQKLNQQRQLGQLCDITVVIQGHRFRAHRAVLAASSPYFCDQVLLKNSVRVVLPDVMLPSVFESLLQSCYTGTLLLPAGEVVAFLTAASFLQMWHVVDKCTELLEANPSRKSHPGSERPSPANSGYGSPSEAFELGLFGKISDCDGGGAELVAGGRFSPCEAGDRVPPGRSPTSARDGGSPGLAPLDGEDRGGDVTEGRYSWPLYVQPNIVCHRRWIRVKAEKTEREACDGSPVETKTEADAELELTSPAEDELGLPTGTCAENEPEVRMEEGREGRRPYEEPLDFYGTSMEEFSGERAEEPPGGASEDPGGPADGPVDGSELPEALQEEMSHSGFAAVVYKLYPCQCGKSFTHKSQRERHMSMHLGLRPYGCTICGKKFKMKHHLVGHMKIHTGVKPYECSICAKRFMWRDSFNRHVSSCTRAHQAKRAAAAPVC